MRRRRKKKKKRPPQPPSEWNGREEKRTCMQRKNSNVATFSLDIPHYFSTQNWDAFARNSLDVLGNLADFRPTLLYFSLLSPVTDDSKLLLPLLRPPCILHPHMLWSKRVRETEEEEHMMQRRHLTWHWKKEGSDRRRRRNWRWNKRGPSSDSLFFSIELHGIQGFVCLFLCCSIFIVFMLCINFLELISRVLFRKRAGILHCSTPFLLPSGLPFLSLLHSKCREDKYWTGREEMGRKRKREKSPLLVDGSGIQQ